MKLVNYKCTECSYQEEVLYNDSEEVKESLINICPSCGGNLKKYNFKNNQQVWKFMDKEKV